MKFFLLKKLYSFFGELEKPQLRVIIFHNIKKKNEKKFGELILYLKKNWNIISPKIFRDHIYNKKVIENKRNILITFDDGYKSQKIVCEKFLDPLNIKALFFVVSDFVNIVSKHQAFDFVNKNFYFDKKRIDVEEDMSNMNIIDLKQLILNGHSIGGHTRTHACLSRIKKENIIYDEVVKSCLEMEKKLNYNIVDFAYTFGDINSINRISSNLILNHFELLYSGLRGNNLRQKSKIIRRDAINLNEPLEVIASYLNGYVDFLYKAKLKKLEKWNTLKNF